MAAANSPRAPPRRPRRQSEAGPAMAARQAPASRRQKGHAPQIPQGAFGLTALLRIAKYAPSRVAQRSSEWPLGPRTWRETGEGRIHTPLPTETRKTDFGMPTPTHTHNVPLVGWRKPTDFAAWPLAQNCGPNGASRMRIYAGGRGPPRKSRKRRGVRRSPHASSESIMLRPQTRAACEKVELNCPRARK